MGTKLTVDQNAPSLTSDASADGWGGVIVLPSGQMIKTQGRWTEEEKKNLSSNSRELTAISLTYFPFRHYIPKGSQLRIQTDNTSAIAYLTGKGNLPHLLDIAKPMISDLHRRRLSPLVKHIPGEQNTLSDKLSRRFHRNHDWCLNDQATTMVIDRWGPVSWDLFADHNNSKASKFMSWHHVPNSQGVDSLSLNWHTLQGRLFICPPFPLIAKVLNKLSELLKYRTQAQVSLILPKWPGALWWPSLKKLPIYEILELGQSPQVIHPGPSGYCPSQNGFAMIAANLR